MAVGRVSGAERSRGDGEETLGVRGTWGSTRRESACNGAQWGCAIDVSGDLPPTVLVKGCRRRPFGVGSEE